MLQQKFTGLNNIKTYEIIISFLFFYIIVMVINMLTADYEQSYISSFTKIFVVLKNEYEVYVKPCEEDNYEIEINKVNKQDIQEYLSICFQKQNGSLTIISSKKIDDKIVKKLVKDVALALNDNPLASYCFKDLNEYIIYYFSYVKENIIVDNKKLLEDLLKNKKIEDLEFNINFINNSL